MMRVLIDANVILDVLLDRQPFVGDSKRVWEACDEGRFDGCIATFTIPTIYYICQKHAGAAAAADAVDRCLEGFEIAALYRECILAARRMPGGDFEDNLQIACAITDFMQGIVTRNTRDFTNSPIHVYTPAEFLRVLNR